MSAPLTFDIMVDDPTEVVVAAPMPGVDVVVAADPSGLEVIVASDERGPAGPPGPQGPRGTKWFFGHGPPTVVVGSRFGDMYRDLDTGLEYQLT